MSLAATLFSDSRRRVLEGEIKSRFAGNILQEKKFSELLANVINRYQNRAFETVQVIEELIEMTRKFRAAADREAHSAQVQISARLTGRGHCTCFAAG